MKRIFLFFQIAFCCLFCWNYTAFAYNDSTSFDPTEASIKPKAIGGVPVGTIVAWPISKNPEDMENWLECNGQTISQTVYPELFALLGSRVPDYRGLFLRGLGGNSAALGVQQGDAIRNITGSWASKPPMWEGVYHAPRGCIGIIANGKGAGGGPQFSGQAEIFKFDASLIVPTASENRPVNTSVRYFVRSRP